MASALKQRCGRAVRAAQSVESAAAHRASREAPRQEAEPLGAHVTVPEPQVILHIAMLLASGSTAHVLKCVQQLSQTPDGRSLPRL